MGSYRIALSRFKILHLLTSFELSRSAIERVVHISLVYNAPGVFGAAFRNGVNMTGEGEYPLSPTKQEEYKFRNNYLCGRIK